MLSRSECFKVLGLDESAGPNAIKRAYRKLAFELHPDLNPDVPEASRRFQQLNEAYVMLMQEYSNTSFAAGKRPTGARPGPTPSGGRSQADARANDKARAEARRAYAKASSGFNSGAAGQAQPGESPGAAGFGGAESTAGPSGSAGSSHTNQARPGDGRGPGAYQPNREEMLRDLLNDPFARRVFEDIYSTVRYNTGKGAKTGKAAPPRPPKQKVPARAKAAPRKSVLAAAGSKVLGLADGVKGWLRKQIDDEQVMFLPGENLMPGARVRLQVSHGFSGDKRTIEFTLPPEFLPGKPIRLKGLGRRLGNMQGDLYLRVFSAEDRDE